MDQTGLADACRAQHREQVAPSVSARGLKRLHQHTELSFPSDHRRTEAALDPWCVRTHRDETESVDGSGLALHGQGSGRLDLDRIADKPVGRFAEDNLPRHRRLF
jgi:hypothetical protein